MNLLTPSTIGHNKGQVFFDQGVTPPIFKGANSVGKQPMSFVQQQFFNGPINDQQPGHDEIDSIKQQPTKEKNDSSLNLALTPMNPNQANQSNPKGLDVFNFNASD